MTRDGGVPFRWDGFYTGPLTLDDSTLAAAAQQLLNLSVDDVPAAAERVLRPAASDRGAEGALIVHSATRGLRSLEADLGDAESRRTPDDVATYVETRAVSLARTGDVVVGRTAPWRLAAELAGLERVTIPDLDHYYLSHAIIKLALDSDGRAPELAYLAALLQARPTTLVRLYALDREMQIVLLTLARLANLDEIRTDANSPAVADHWNAKAPLHPTVDDALTLDVRRRDPQELLLAESALTALHRRLGVQTPLLPGYTIDAAEREPDAFTERLLSAARLLRERYDLRLGCLKPSEAGAGARIVTAIELNDLARLRELAGRAWGSREAYVLEAHIAYERAHVDGDDLLVAPSGHIRAGRVAEGLTLQITNGTSWQGNVYLDEQGCQAMGLSREHYRVIIDAIAELRAAFATHDLGLATAGFDFAVGRIGGTFGDKVLVALQDPNLSSHGAEYLRHFLDSVWSAGGPPYGATKVICPAPGQTLDALRTFADEDSFTVMSSIPGRWGMIAAAAESPQAAAREILSRARELERRGAILRVAPR
ncbi:MAG TPA: hypothetical protein VF526_09600 [Solirubrobacteraceae bacterium]